MSLKRLIVALISIMLISVLCFAEQITLKWDPPEGDIDGIRIYRNTEGDYNYDQPVTTDAYPDGNLPPDATELVVDLQGRPDEAVKYFFVARAFRNSEMSIDSNEAEYTVVRIMPITPVNLSGEYSKSESIIKLAYDQPPDDWAIHHWILYYRVGSTEYQVLGAVDAGQELKLEAPFNAVAPGEKETVYFTVVAYRRSGVFSKNSNELAIEIDRTVVNPPQNFRIELEIPVQ